MKLERLGISHGHQWEEGDYMHEPTKSSPQTVLRRGIRFWFWFWPVYQPGHPQLPEAELQQLATHCHFVGSSHRYSKRQRASNRDLEISWRASTIKMSGWGYCTVPTPAAARFHPLITWLESGVTALVPGKIKFGTCMLVQ